MLKFHHVGCLVESIDESIGIYKNLFAIKNISDKIYIASQGVYVCFVQMGNNEFIELVEPKDEDSVVHRLKQKGFSYYHIGYLVGDIDKTINDLEDKHFKLLNTFYSEAFQMKKCAFLFSPETHLIELIQE